VVGGAYRASSIAAAVFALALAHLVRVLPTWVLRIKAKIFFSIFYLICRSLLLGRR